MDPGGVSPDPIPADERSADELADDELAADELTDDELADDELSDEDLARRARIVEVAATLFAERGYRGTRIRSVADQAGMSTYTVRRLTGNRAGLFRLVLAAKVSSPSAQRVAAAVQSPDATPPLAVGLAALRDVFLDPTQSWDVLELGALVRARFDSELLELETERLTGRYDNVAALIRQLREAGGIDDNLDDRALAHHAMALSIGLAMLDPVIPRKPTLESWNALMARLHIAAAPAVPVPEITFTATSRWRVRVDVPDRPGDLPRLTRALSALHVHTLAVYVVGAGGGYRTFDLALTAPDTVTPDEILAAARSVGRDPYVSAGDPDDALDLPTRVIDGATQLVATPGWAPTGARLLAEADTVEVVPAVEGAETSPYVLRLQWTPTRHVVLRRDWAPFASAERTRASALLRLSAAVAAMTGDDERLGWVETIRDATVWVRLAQPIDADAVMAMHDRCSQDTLYKRYVSLAQWQEVQLRRLAGGHRGASLVVVNETGDVIALGNIVPERSGPGHAAEVALLVEDAYQGRGVGQSLLHHLVRMARDLGFTEVVAEALADNKPILGTLEKVDLPWTRAVADGFATWRATLS